MSYLRVRGLTATSARKPRVISNVFCVLCLDNGELLGGSRNWVDEPWSKNCRQVLARQPSGGGLHLGGGLGRIWVVADIMPACFLAAACVGWLWFHWVLDAVARAAAEAD